MRPEDYERIFAQHLSPLYISVHATDDAVRRHHLSAPNARPILPDMKRLIEHGIALHTQIVVVPGVNDGAALDRTIADLANLYPGILSVGVVPVGLTKYRENLPKVRPNTPEEGRRMLEQVDQARMICKRLHRVPLVYAADEAFILAGAPIPPAEYYGDFPQLENGIGLVRRLIDDFEQEFENLPEALPAARELTMLTGRAAAPFLRPLAERAAERVHNLTLSVLAVPSRFWGETVTVSGLLTGGDIAETLVAADLSGNDILLPPDCLNTDGLFLDDETVATVERTSGAWLHTSTYDLVSTLNAVLADL